MDNEKAGDATQQLWQHMWKQRDIQGFWWSTIPISTQTLHERSGSFFARNFNFCSLCLQFLGMEVNELYSSA